MNNTVTAQDLKTKGISIADSFAKQGLETIVTVRGEPKYIILTRDEYYSLKEYELLCALAESERDLKNGNYKEQTAEEHIKELKNA